MQLTLEQQNAADAILRWLDDGNPEDMTLGGFAGTGKTTLIKHLIEQSDKLPVVMALSGKAVSVLRKKGVYAATIHSTIYRASQDGKKVHFTLRHRSEVHGNFFIVDEASMVSTELYRDLRSFDRPILWVGDHGQLEPIGDSPNLMRDPQLRLESIMRQALDNPIIAFAHKLREGVVPGYTGKGGLVIKKEMLSNEDALAASQIVCGIHNTRVSLNQFFRNVAGRNPDQPEVGDRVICLKNNKDHGIFNGMQGEIQSLFGSFKSDAKILLEDGSTFEGPILLRQFNHHKGLADNPRQWEVTHWDYSYAVTCHKAQGSEWPFVIVVEDPSHVWNMARWRYTAATRAQQKLIYCVP